MTAMGYKCPRCEAVSLVNAWKETEVGCEDCGSHTAIICPSCGETIDSVYDNLNEVEVSG